MWRSNNGTEGSSKQAKSKLGLSIFDEHSKLTQVNINKFAASTKWLTCWHLLKRKLSLSIYFFLHWSLLIHTLVIYNDSNITVTSSWVWWCLKLAAPWLFTQLFVLAQIKENIKALGHCPLWGEFTCDQCIPHIKGPWCRKCFHLMASSWRNWWKIFW